MPLWALVGVTALAAGASTYQQSAATTQAKKSAGNQKATLEAEAVAREKALKDAAVAAEAAPGLADQAAKDALKKRRRSILMSGGDTDITGDTLGNPGTGNLAVKSLLGA